MAIPPYRDWESLTVDQLGEIQDDLAPIIEANRKAQAEADAYAQEVLANWDDWQRRARELEAKYQPRLRRLGSLTHAELTELGNEIHQHITDDAAAGGTLLCNAEVAAIAVMKVQLIKEMQKRRIVANAFGTPGQVKALRGLATRARKDRKPLVGDRKPRRAKSPPPGQQKLM